MPYAVVAPSPEMQLKGGIASLSPSERAAVAARAAAALMQRANAACDAPMLRSMPRAKEVAAQHDWVSADWIAESMADTVDSFCLDSAMGPMDADGYDFSNEGSGFEVGWLPGEGKYAHAGGPISAAEFGGNAGGGFGASFEPCSLQVDSFAVPDIAAGNPPHSAFACLPAGFLSDMRFPMAVSPDLPLGYGGLPAAGAAAALRSNSCSDPARVPSLMVVNVPIGFGGYDEASNEPTSDNGPGSPDGRSQRLAARAARAARRAAAGSDFSDGGHLGADGAQPELMR